MTIDPKALGAALEAPILPYYISLGRFVLAFAEVEANLRAALQACNGTIKVGEFSGPGVGEVFAEIKRIAKAENWAFEQRAPLDTIAKQLQRITTVRNDILHYGTKSTGVPGELYSIKAFDAHTEERIRKTRINSAILDEMTYDCLKLCVHIGTIGREPDPDHERIFNNLLRAPWRYEREQPEPSPT